MPRGSIVSKAVGDDARGVGEDLTAALDTLIADEVEHDRLASLQAIRLLATEERRERQANRLKALKASILGGAGARAVLARRCKGDRACQECRRRLRRSY